MERTTWALIFCFAIGGAALVLALVPSAWPNPLAGVASADAAMARPELDRAAAAVDAAFAAGDGEALAGVTTASFRRDLERRLEVFDRQLDAATLRAMAAADGGAGRWLERPFVSLESSAQRVAVAVRRDAARGEGRGMQLVVFYWDGQRFRLDLSRHEVDCVDAAAAREQLVRILRER